VGKVKVFSELIPCCLSWTLREQGLRGVRKQT